MVESTNEQWIENVQALLSSGDSDVIRCHEGGGPEDLIASLVLTVMRTRNSRDKAIEVNKRWMHKEEEKRLYPRIKG